MLSTNVPQVRYGIAQAGVAHTNSIYMLHTSRNQLSLLTCPVISKVFELGILDRYNFFLSSSDNQFDLKTNLMCNHDIFSLRKVVDIFTSNVDIST